MRLVTYRDAGGFQRAGALLEKDHLVLDLQVASETIHGHARPEFASVLALSNPTAAIWPDAGAPAAKVPAATLICTEATAAVAPAAGKSPPKAATEIRPHAPAPPMASAEWLVLPAMGGNGPTTGFIESQPALPRG